MFYPKLEDFINQVVNEFDQISTERKISLDKVTAYVETCIENQQIAHLIFICTHNSRRSHFGQIWAQTAADYYRIQPVETYSGGTETTALNSHVVEALTKTGFKIEKSLAVLNPVYSINYKANGKSIRAFSKVYDDPANPNSGFCAVMTCSDADEHCPVIPGANLRIPITYDDPKIFDGTEKESEAYEERSHQIAREMFYLFSRVKPKD